MFKRKPDPVIPASRVKAVIERPAPMDYDDGPSLPHRPTRSKGFKQALLTLAHGAKLPVVIRDMSSDGLRVEFFQNTLLGDIVHINEPSIPLSAYAEVVWETDGAAGLRLKDR
jgi:hypothetical protein